MKSRMSSKSLFQTNRLLCNILYSSQEKLLTYILFEKTLLSIHVRLCYIEYCKKRWTPNFGAFLDCGCLNNVMRIQTYLGLDLSLKFPTSQSKQYHSAQCLTAPSTSGALKHRPSGYWADLGAQYPNLRINDICLPNPGVFWTNILSY